MALSYLYKDDFLLSPSDVAKINSICLIPWIIKPVYGLISDSIPIFGYRRKPYLFIFGVLGSVCWILMSFSANTITKAVTFILIGQVCTAFCNVIGEALVDETSQRQKDVDPEAGAKNVSMFFLIKSVGSLMTAFSSGALLEIMDKRNVFLITASFPLILVISSILLKESTESNDNDIEITNYQTIESEVKYSNKNNHPEFKKQFNLFISFIKLDQIYKPVIFIFIYIATPSYGDPMFYFYTNELKFTPSIMGRLKLIYGIASVLGIMIYNKYLKNISFKKIMFWSTIISMIFNMLSIVVVTRINLLIGITDFWFCITADALTIALAEINSMPLLVLACNLCPKNIEGTLYAFLMSVNNFGYLASNQFGALLTNILGITNTNFKNLSWLIVISNIILVLPLPALSLIKEEKIKEEIVSDSEQNTLIRTKDEIIV